MVQLDVITRRQALIGLTLGAAAMTMPAIGAAPPQIPPPKPLGYLWRGCRRVATILVDGDRGVALSISATPQDTMREAGDRRPTRTYGPGRHGSLEAGLIVAYGRTEPEATLFTGLESPCRPDHPDVSGPLVDQLVGGWLALELEGVAEKLELPDATLTSATICGDGYTLRNAVFSIGGWPDGGWPPCHLTAFVAVPLSAIDVRLAI